MTATIRIGTCAFADETLVQHWYPKGVRTAEARLRFYASWFDSVEVDSAYYALPTAENAARWAERTPPGFVFHVKAFGMMTRHPVRLEQLPADLRSAVETTASGRVERPSLEIRAEVFSRFHAALEPLRRAGKLGGVLMQFPPYVVPKASSLEYLVWARERLGGDEMLVEFRHRSWLDDVHRAETLRFLEELGATTVVVDAPRIDAKNVLATVVAVTSATAYVRMHGRNATSWNVRGRSAAERFDYLYAEDELRAWVEPLRELAALSERVYVMFNTNGRSAIETAPGEPILSGTDGRDRRGWIAQGPANALLLRRVLQEAGLPVSDPSG